MYMRNSTNFIIINYVAWTVRRYMYIYTFLKRVKDGCSIMGIKQLYLTFADNDTCVLVFQKIVNDRFYKTLVRALPSGTV